MGDVINFLIFFFFFKRKKKGQRKKMERDFFSFFFSRFSLDKKGCFQHWRKIRFEESTLWHLPVPHRCILRKRSAICHQLVTALGLHQIGIRAKRSEYWEAMAARNARGHRGGNYVTMEMFQELQELIQQLAAAFEQVTGNRGNGRNRDPDHSREEEEALYQLSERK